MKEYTKGNEVAISPQNQRSTSWPAQASVDDKYRAAIDLYIKGFGFKGYFALTQSSGATTPSSMKLGAMTTPIELLGGKLSVKSFSSTIGGDEAARLLDKDIFDKVSGYFPGENNEIMRDGPKFAIEASTPQTSFLAATVGLKLFDLAAVAAQVYMSELVFAAQFSLDLSFNKFEVSLSADKEYGQFRLKDDLKISFELPAINIFGVQIYKGGHLDIEFHLDASVRLSKTTLNISIPTLSLSVFGFTLTLPAFSFDFNFKNLFQQLAQQIPKLIMKALTALLTNAEAVAKFVANCAGALVDGVIKVFKKLGVALDQVKKWVGALSQRAAAALETAWKAIDAAAAAAAAAVRWAAEQARRAAEVVAKAVKGATVAVWNGAKKAVKKIFSWFRLQNFPPGSALEILSTMVRHHFTLQMYAATPAEFLLRNAFPLLTGTTPPLLRIDTTTTPPPPQLTDIITQQYPAILTQTSQFTLDVLKAAASASSFISLSTIPDQSFDTTCNNLRLQYDILSTDFTQLLCDVVFLPRGEDKQHYSEAFPNGTALNHPAEQTIYYFKHMLNVISYMDFLENALTQLLTFNQRLNTTNHGTLIDHIVDIEHSTPITFNVAQFFITAVYNIQSGLYDIVYGDNSLNGEIVMTVCRITTPRATLNTMTTNADGIYTGKVQFHDGSGWLDVSDVPKKAIPTADNVLLNLSYVIEYSATAPKKMIYKYRSIPPQQTASTTAVTPAVWKDAVEHHVNNCFEHYQHQCFCHEDQALATEFNNPYFIVPCVVLGTDAILDMVIFDSTPYLFSRWALTNRLMSSITKFTSIVKCTNTAHPNCYVVNLENQTTRHINYNYGVLTTITTPGVLYEVWRVAAVSTTLKLYPIASFLSTTTESDDHANSVNNMESRLVSQLYHSAFIFNRLLQTNTLSPTLDPVKIRAMLDEVNFKRCAAIPLTCNTARYFIRADHSRRRLYYNGGFPWNATIPELAASPHKLKDVTDQLCGIKGYVSSYTSGAATAVLTDMTGSLTINLKTIDLPFAMTNNQAVQMFFTIHYTDDDPSFVECRLKHIIKLQQTVVLNESWIMSQQQQANVCFDVFHDVFLSKNEQLVVRHAEIPSHVIPLSTTSYVIPQPGYCTLYGVPIPYHRVFSLCSLGTNPNTSILTIYRVDNSQNGSMPIGQYTIQNSSYVTRHQQDATKGITLYPSRVDRFINGIGSDERSRQRGLHLYYFATDNTTHREFAKHAFRQILQSFVVTTSNNTTYYNINHDYTKNVFKTSDNKALVMNHKKYNIYQDHNVMDEYNTNPNTNFAITNNTIFTREIHPNTSSYVLRKLPTPTQFVYDVPYALTSALSNMFLYQGNADRIAQSTTRKSWFVFRRPFRSQDRAADVPNGFLIQVAMTDDDDGSATIPVPESPDAVFLYQTNTDNSAALQSRVAPLSTTLAPHHIIWRLAQQDLYWAFTAYYYQQATSTFKEVALDNPSLVTTEGGVMNISPYHGAMKQLFSITPISTASYTITTSTTITTITTKKTKVSKTTAPFSSDVQTSTTETTSSISIPDVSTTFLPSPATATTTTPHPPLPLTSLISVDKRVYGRNGTSTAATIDTGFYYDTPYTFTSLTTRTMPLYGYRDTTNTTTSSYTSLAQSSIPGRQGYFIFRRPWAGSTAYDQKDQCLFFIQYVHNYEDTYQPVFDARSTVLQKLPTRIETQAYQVVAASFTNVPAERCLWYLRGTTTAIMSANNIDVLDNHTRVGNQLLYAWNDYSSAHEHQHWSIQPVPPFVPNNIYGRETTTTSATFQTPYKYDTPYIISSTRAMNLLYHAPSLTTGAIVQQTTDANKYGYFVFRRDEEGFSNCNFYLQYIGTDPTVALKPLSDPTTMLLKLTTTPEAIPNTSEMAYKVILGPLISGQAKPTWYFRRGATTGSFSITSIANGSTLDNSNFEGDGRAMYSYPTWNGQSRQQWDIRQNAVLLVHSSYQNPLPQAVSIEQCDYFYDVPYKLSCLKVPFQALSIASNNNLVQTANEKNHGYFVLRRQSTNLTNLSFYIQYLGTASTTNPLLTRPLTTAQVLQEATTKTAQYDGFAITRIAKSITSLTTTNYWRFQYPTNRLEDGEIRLYSQSGYFLDNTQSADEGRQVFTRLAQHGEVFQRWVLKQYPGARKSPQALANLPYLIPPRLKAPIQLLYKSASVVYTSLYCDATHHLVADTQTSTGVVKYSSFIFFPSKTAPGWFNVQVVPSSSAISYPHYTLPEARWLQNVNPRVRATQQLTQIELESPDALWSLQPSSTTSTVCALVSKVDGSCISFSGTNVILNTTKQYLWSPNPTPAPRTTLPAPDIQRIVATHKSTSGYLSHYQNTPLTITSTLTPTPHTASNQVVLLATPSTSRPTFTLVPCANQPGYYSIYYKQTATTSPMAFYVDPLAPSGVGQQFFTVCYTDQPHNIVNQSCAQWRVVVIEGKVTFENRLGHILSSRTQNGATALVGVLFPLSTTIPLQFTLTSPALTPTQQAALNNAKNVPVLAALQSEVTPIFYQLLPNPIVTGTPVQMNDMVSMLPLELIKDGSVNKFVPGEVGAVDYNPTRFVFKPSSIQGYYIIEHTPTNALGATTKYLTVQPNNASDGQLVLANATTSPTTHMLWQCIVDGPTNALYIRTQSGYYLDNPLNVTPRRLSQPIWAYKKWMGQANQQWQIQTDLTTAYYDLTTPAKPSPLRTEYIEESVVDLSNALYYKSPSVVVEGMFDYCLVLNGVVHPIDPRLVKNAFVPDDGLLPPTAQKDVFGFGNDFFFLRADASDQVFEDHQFFQLSTPLYFPIKKHQYYPRIGHQDTALTGFVTALPTCDFDAFNHNHDDENDNENDNDNIQHPTDTDPQPQPEDEIINHAIPVVSIATEWDELSIPLDSAVFHIHDLQKNIVFIGAAYTPVVFTDWTDPKLTMLCPSRNGLGNVLEGTFIHKPLFATTPTVTTTNTPSCQTTIFVVTSLEFLTIFPHLVSHEDYTANQQKEQDKEIIPFSERPPLSDYTARAVLTKFAHIENIASKLALLDFQNVTPDAVEGIAVEYHHEVYFILNTSTTTSERILLYESVGPDFLDTTRPTTRFTTGWKAFPM